MAIVIFIESLAANGSQQTQRLEFNQRRIQIGRGAGCDLRFESKSVALKQAVLYEADGSLHVENLDAAKPLLLNGEKKERAVLSEGDELQWGDCLINVEKVNDGIQLRTVVEVREALDRKSLLSRELSVFDMDRWMSKTTVFSVIAFVTVVFLFLIIPATKSKEIWNPGPLASAHRVLEAQCSSCHSGSFAELKDEKCLNCHALSTHGDHHLKVKRCVDCHREHRQGIDFTLTDSRLCSECHEREIDRAERIPLKAVPSFDGHPDFSWSQNHSSKSSSFFPHNKHLQKDLESREGLKTLHCIDCHRPQDDRLHFEKISFEKHCADCHGLDFNLRGSRATLPHGTTDEAFRRLKQVVELGAGSSLNESSETKERRRPGLSAPRVLSAGTLREMEQSLMGKSLCGSCHEMQERKAFGDHQSRYDIVKVEAKKRELKIPSFYRLHQSHQSIACLSCHESVQRSETVEEDLWPRKGNCESCHRDQASGIFVGLFVPSPCSLCHGYHESLVLEPSREGRMSPEGGKER